VRVGFPKIAAFELTSANLPAPANLTGNQHHCVLALLHHASDPFNATQTNTDALSLTERKSAHKNLWVVQFTGTVPPEAPLIMPLRLHNGSPRIRLSRLLLQLGRYPGRVRIYAPPLAVDGELRELVEGAEVGDDFDDFARWAERHMEDIERNQSSEHPYDPEWARERLEEVKAALESGVMLTPNAKQTAVHRLALDEERHQTLFLAFDRPPRGKVGSSYPIEIQHLDERGDRLIGGITVRVDLVPEPPKEEYALELWRAGGARGYIGGRLLTGHGTGVTPDAGAEIELAVVEAGGRPKPLGRMRWHRRWRFFHTSRGAVPAGETFTATGFLDGEVVAEVTAEL
jgi:hypothetical protein